jgi:hypothetical protein
VLVDSIKPTLKAPGCPGNKCLKLKYDEVVSNFAFEFNLRRYNLDLSCTGAGKASALVISEALDSNPVGWVLITSTRPTLCSEEASPCACMSTHAGISRAGASDLGSSASSDLAVTQGTLHGGRQFLRNRRSNRHIVPLYGNLTVYLLKVSNSRRVDRHLR